MYRSFIGDPTQNQNWYQNTTISQKVYKSMHALCIYFTLSTVWGIYEGTKATTDIKIPVPVFMKLGWALCLHIVLFLTVRLFWSTCVCCGIELVNMVHFGKMSGTIFFHFTSQPGGRRWTSSIHLKLIAFCCYYQGNVVQPTDVKIYTNLLYFYVHNMVLFSWVLII